ncbi:hemoglobin subunit beta-1-like [Brachionichthys hirsutus]|uniref:hemoglobin subunit beta-1-like n=1 Tax=Brachionichthys hirsutus TaxID=412623 RepID=UPI00360513BE
MAVLSDKERNVLKDVFGKMDYDDVGRKALQRCLIVYPWTQRYFSAFGDISSPEAIKNNVKIAKHGATVMGGVDRAFKNLDNIKEEFTKLSTLHSETLQVDPNNFRLLCDCMTITIAGNMGTNFKPEIQIALQKFFSVMTTALGTQYY